MRRLRGTIPAAAVSLALLSACAGTTTAADGPAGGSAAPNASGPAAPTGEAPILRVRQMGGFVAPSTHLARLPVVSVYDDGRVITEGPQLAIYPGPALPNLQVQQIPPAAVADLVDKAVAAGVKNGADLGQPGVADAPTTRFTVVTDAGEQTVDAIALREAQSSDPALTAAQKAARAKLAAFLEQLTSLPEGTSAPQPYVPTAVSAISATYVPDDDPALSAPSAVTWPGPALPGESLNEGLDVGCITVEGAEAAELLEAAKSANARTPWSSGGKQWAVTFRPMLPDETDCEGLKAATA